MLFVHCCCFHSVCGPCVGFLGVHNNHCVSPSVRPICFPHIPSGTGYNKNISECEGRIEKSAPRIAFWHHEACLVMPNGDPEGRIFQSYPHTNIINGFFFLLTTVFIYSF